MFARSADSGLFTASYSNSLGIPLLAAAPLIVNIDSISASSIREFNPLAPSVLSPFSTTGNHMQFFESEIHTSRLALLCSTSGISS
ncbi:MAG: hypothetical protein WBZ32_07430 [Candidatus Acidiferrales bacterium]